MDVTIMNRVRDVVLGWFAGRDADIKIVNEAFDAITMGGAQQVGLALPNDRKICVDADYAVRIVLPKSVDIGELKQETIDFVTSDLTPEDKAVVEEVVKESREAHCYRFSVPIRDKIIFFEGNNAHRFENVRN